MAKRFVNRATVLESITGNRRSISREVNEFYFKLEDDITDKVNKFREDYNKNSI